MFTGIVEELGTVEQIEQRPDAVVLTIAASTVLEGTAPGDSISVNGCCLTVVEADDGRWRTDVMAETLHRTTTGALAAGDRVNLERAATLQTRLGGHLVQGHVDGTGTVRRRTPSDPPGQWELVEVEAPASLLPYLVEKGSVTVDGVSLTIVEVLPDGFTVSLIPETLARTTLGGREVGTRVNLEADVIAKHVERLLEARR